MRGTIPDRIGKLPWANIESSLGGFGYAPAGQLLTAKECRDLIALYPRKELFRSRIEMARYRFGVGDYQYFAAPLPELISDVREHAYPHLAGIANRWMEALGDKERFPATHPELVERCREVGQTRPTPLLLHYEVGGYNCLHQDLYGDLAFPMQMVCFLSKPGVDYTGGDFLMVEQRPRAQSIGEPGHAEPAEAVLFTAAI